MEWKTGQGTLLNSLLIIYLSYHLLVIFGESLTRWLLARDGGNGEGSEYWLNCPWIDVTLSLWNQ